MVHTTICGSGTLVISSGTVVYPFGVITNGSSTLVHVCKNSSCLQKQFISGTIIHTPATVVHVSVTAVPVQGKGDRRNKGIGGSMYDSCTN